MRRDRNRDRVLYPVKSNELFLIFQVHCYITSSAFNAKFSFLIFNFFTTYPVQSRKVTALSMLDLRLLHYNH